MLFIWWQSWIVSIQSSVSHDPLQIILICNSIVIFHNIAVFTARHLSIRHFFYKHKKKTELFQTFDV